MTLSKVERAYEPLRIKTATALGLPLMHHGQTSTKRRATIRVLRHVFA
jgi:hypothetical protein